MKKLTFLLLIFATTCLRAQTGKQSFKAAINVLVINKSKTPLGNVEVSFESVKNKKVYSGVSGADGKFQLEVPAGDKYMMKYQAGVSKQDYAPIEIANQEGLTISVKLTISPPTTFTLDNVFFDSGKSSLKQQSFAELNELVKFLTMQKNVVIEIGGHTDNVGNETSNQKLSQDRSDAVKSYLVAKGIGPERVEARGYGASSPVADNSTEAGRKQNRRTAVKILKQ
jgi:OOP family OmpA-OmpF porin